MKLAFEQHHIPSSRSILVGMESKLDDLQMDMPLIVKPTDRSGSRGICKISSMSELKAAIAGACKQSFEKKALIEEYIEGQEYSVECISWNGEHNFLATTKKFTTGAPNFIETAHMEPADLSESEIEKIKKIVFRALDALEIKYGASHSEIKINSGGEIKVIEIGGRMGGDCIGSDLVFLSTGIDFVKAVIQISLGKKPKLDRGACPQCAAVRYVLNSRDLLALQEMESRHPEMVVRKEVMQLSDRDVTDSSTRFGMYVLKSDTVEAFKEYLPEDIL
jgi:biotin carboxylase